MMHTPGTQRRDEPATIRCPNGHPVGTIPAGTTVTTSRSGAPTEVTCPTCGARVVYRTKVVARG